MTRDFKAFAPMKGAAFRRLWLAHHVASFGEMIQAAGAAWLMVTLTTSGEMVALVQTAAALPYLLLGLLSGALADTFSRKFLMVCARLTGLSCGVGLAVCILSGQLTPWLLICLVFLAGCCSTLYAPAWQASIGDLVARDGLAGAVLLNDTSFNLNRSLAPAVTGLILANGGVATPFVLGTITYLPSIVVLARWCPSRASAGRKAISLHKDIGSILLLVMRSRQLRVIMLRSFAFGFGACSANALMPVMSQSVLHAGPYGFGLLLGAFGVGALAAVLVNFRLREIVSSESVVAIAFLVSAAGIFVLALAGSLYLAASAMLLVGAGWLFSFSSFNTAVQLLVERESVGRALSIFHVVTFAGIALGSWLWGVMSDSAGFQCSLLVSMLVLVCGALAGLRTPMIEITSRAEPDNSRPAVN